MEIAPPVLLRIRNAFRVPQFRYPALAVVLGIVVSLAYLPGLAGPFVLDDIPNLVQNSALVPPTLTFETIKQAALSGISGALGRPLAMVSFALNAYYAGGLQSALPFKVTNLIIHLVNALLVYALCRLLQHRLPARFQQNNGWMPLAVAAAWALHPMQLTAVLYSVQRMTSLSALFVLVGLIIFTHARARYAEAPSRGLLIMGGGLALGLILGCAVKENAILILVYAGVIELTMFDRTALSKRARVLLGGFYTGTLLVPVLIGALAIALEPSLVTADYAGRDFTLTQRLLTQMRVLWYYLGLLFAPRLGAFGLHHDDMVVSTSIIDPWQTLPSLTGMIVIAAASWLARGRFPALALAGLWFLVGHAMESSIIALEIAYEHRNYLPSVGFIFGAVSVLGSCAAHTHYRRWVQAGVVLWIASLGLVTWLRAGTWSSDEQLIVTTARHHPESAKSQAMLAELLAIRYHKHDLALERYAYASQLAPTEPGYLIERVKIACSGSGATSRRAPTGAALLTRKPDARAKSSGNDPDQSEVTPMPPGSLLSPDLPPVIWNRITNQLRSGPISAFTIRALVSTTDRATETVGTCRMLAPEFAKWHHAVIQNTRTNARWHRAAIFSLFELTFELGDYPGALAAADAGLRTTPGSMDYGLMRADALIVLKRLDEAERLLTQLGNRAASHDHAESISVLRTKIDTQRKQSSPRRRESTG